MATPSAVAVVRRIRLPGKREKQCSIAAPSLNAEEQAERQLANKNLFDNRECQMDFDAICSLKCRLDAYEALKQSGLLHNQQTRETALSDVFQMPVCTERNLARSYRQLCRRVHPDKITDVVENRWNFERTVPLLYVFKQLQAAWADVHDALRPDVQEAVIAPSNVDAFYSGDGASMSLWLIVDAADSDLSVNAYGDAQSFVQIEIPDGTGQKVVILSSF